MVSYRRPNILREVPPALRTASLRCRRQQAARARRPLRQLHRAQVEGVRLPLDRLLDAHREREEQPGGVHLGLGKLRGAHQEERRLARRSRARQEVGGDREGRAAGEPRVQPAHGADLVFPARPGRALRTGRGGPQSVHLRAARVPGDAGKDHQHHRPVRQLHVWSLQEARLPPGRLLAEPHGRQRSPAGLPAGLGKSGRAHEQVRRVRQGPRAGPRVRRERKERADCAAGGQHDPASHRVLPDEVREAKAAMKVSFFETARYCAPQALPSEWPVPSGAYARDAGARAYGSMIERLHLLEGLGFDLVSVSADHYSPLVLTPAPIVSASYIAARLRKIKIALLGPIVPQSNPVRVAEELAMLDTLAQGRLVVGLLRGTTNESLTYDLNPAEARERTDEGMELILRAWTEPQPFGWQGRHFQYRTISIWPRPLQQPYPTTYALGTRREAGEFAARHHLGGGVSYGSFEGVGRATRYYREECARYGWEPTPEQIIYRANMLLADTDEEAHEALRKLPGQAPFSMRPGVRDAMMTVDSRNIAGEARSPIVSGALPTTFIGSPDTVVEQVRRCREVVGAGVIDRSRHPPGSTDLEPLMRSLELFGKKVLPRIRDI